MLTNETEEKPFTSPKKWKHHYTLHTLSQTFSIFTTEDKKFSVFSGNYTNQKYAEEQLAANKRAHKKKTRGSSPKLQSWVLAQLTNNFPPRKRRVKCTPSFVPCGQTRPPGSFSARPPTRNQRCISLCLFPWACFSHGETSTHHWNLTKFIRLVVS